MLKYLLENHIYFFYYLDPLEVNKLISVSKYYPQYITNNVWKEMFIINNKIEKIIEFPTSINIIYNKLAICLSFFSFLIYNSKYFFWFTFIF